MRSIWEITEPDQSAAANIAQFACIPPLLAQCLINRGFTNPEDIDDFLHPKLARLSDPFLLPNMQIGVDRLFAARAAGERVVIFGDYDVDGVTSCALLNESLSALGWQTATYLPHRMDEGYGLSLEAAKKCLIELQPNLLLAVDCGSTNIESIAWINEQNVDVLVLDHHQVPKPAPAARLISASSARSRCKSSERRTRAGRSGDDCCGGVAMWSAIFCAAARSASIMFLVVPAGSTRISQRRVRRPRPVNAEA